MKCCKNELQKLLPFAFGDSKAILLEVFRGFLIGNIWFNGNAEQHFLFFVSFGGDECVNLPVV